ncbi:MAG TPA: NAD(P)/FAD-dependent oxidoreductase [Polyangiaceae bacterium]|nr:NAD(P)/FAD-dependent oxidoreductase [Polyangiaceae bacterium]
MNRPDAYRLANLPLGRKLTASLALLLALWLFGVGWLASVLGVNWAVNAMTVLDWGERLAMLPTELYWFLFAAHVASLAIVFPVTNGLFRQTPLPRLTRRALFALTAAVSALDVACWLLAPHAPVARAALGAVVLLTTAFLSYLVLVPLRSMWFRARWPEAPATPVRVVVVGGGFAGLYATLGLDRRFGYHRKLELTVIDRKNYFLFPPLLPSVAVGAIETRQITYPFRRLFEASNVVFKKETVVSIDPERKLVKSRVDVDEDAASGELRVRYAETQYDYLVLSPGSTTNTFRTEGIEHAFFMRELADAIALRNHIIDCFETAAREADAELVAKMLRFVVIGAGPTGIEVASEIRDLVDHVLIRHYPEINRASVDVVVIDSGKRVLGGWHDAVASAAESQLAGLGVRVLHGGRVSKLGSDWVLLADGTRLETRTAVWCAGVAPSELLTNSGLPLHKSGRVEVDKDCRVKGHPSVFVLGDAAHFAGDDGKPLPPLGQVAFQQGSHAARNLHRLLRRGSTEPFRYFNFGQLVSVGHQFAAVQLLGLRVTGFFAWVVWRTLYLSKLVGFGNKLRVALDWTLDLFIERSTSQLHATRDALSARASDELSTTMPGHVESEHDARAPLPAATAPATAANR